MGPERAEFSRKAGRAINASRPNPEFERQIRAEAIAYLQFDTPMSDKVRKFIERHGTES